VGRTPQPCLLNTQRHPRRTRHSACQGLRHTGESDGLFCTQLGSPTFPDRQHVLSILLRPVRLHFIQTDWAAYHAFLVDRLPGNPVANNEEAIDKYVEELTSAIQEATAASATKRRPRADSRPTLPTSIHDEICLKYRLRRTGKSRETAL
jgi:hypothetical protein